MATMGEGSVARENSRRGNAVAILLPAGVIATLAKSDVVVPPVGQPIMREGFVINTGFLPTPLSVRTALLTQRVY